jgi:hypothetical protein
MLSSYQFNLLIESIQSKDEITAWLDEMGVKNYIINSDLTVDVDGHVDLIAKKLKSIPIKFNKVVGNFRCSHNQLITLEGAPNEVGGEFDSFRNKLKSLKGSPNKVRDNFICSGNQLTTLEGAPNEVGGEFSCSGNQLTTLEGAPNKVGGDFWCSKNPLKSLDGKPDYVGGGFFISGITYDRLFPEKNNKVWTLDDIDEEPARGGAINIKDKIY